MNFSEKPDNETNMLLERIALALEGDIAPRGDVTIKGGKAYVWESSQRGVLRMVNMDDVLPLESLLGIDEQKSTLYENTRQFAHGHLANNALLWGARGTGKSSLVKSVFHGLQKNNDGLGLVLIEMYREDLTSFPRLLDILRKWTDKRFIIFCDDLSFDGQEQDYKSLKSVLEGGIEGRPCHVLLYATSNRRHLISRSMLENEEKSLIHEGEAIEEKVSLSDRFGLWLGFHSIDQETYLSIVRGYLDRFEVLGGKDWQSEAKRWSRQRGQMSGRVAYQCACDLAGKESMKSNHSGG